MLTLLMFDRVVGDEEAYSSNPQLIKHVVDLDVFLLAEVDAYLDGDAVAGIDQVESDYSIDSKPVGGPGHQVGDVHDVCCLGAVLRRFIVVGTDENFEIQE